MKPSFRPLPGYASSASVENGSSSPSEGLYCSFPTFLHVLEANPPSDDELASLPPSVLGSLLPVTKGDVLKVEERVRENYCLVSLDGRRGHILLNNTVELILPTDKVVAIWDRQSSLAEDLDFDAGDTIEVLFRHDTWWYWGETHGRVGLFPLTYAEPLPSDSNTANSSQIRAYISTSFQNSFIEPKIADGECVRALWDYKGTETRDLSLEKDDIIHIISKFHVNWWLGLLNGRVGMFPTNYVTTDLTPRPKRRPVYPPFQPYYVRALYNLESTEPIELGLVQDDLISVDEMYADMWWTGRGPSGRKGWFPENYVQSVLDRRAYED